MSVWGFRLLITPVDSNDPAIDLCDLRSEAGRRSGVAAQRLRAREGDSGDSTKNSISAADHRFSSYVWYVTIKQTKGFLYSAKLYY